jgi:alpha-tubulin suppressor-like RCC1 family protein
LWSTGAASGQQSVRGWGYQVFDSSWTESRNFVQVAAGSSCGAGCRADGSLVAWGHWEGGTPVPVLPSGLTYVEVAAGSSQLLGRRSDGSVVGWGANLYGQNNVPTLPNGVSYVQLTCGWDGFDAALRSDGTIVAWGFNGYGQ